MSDVVEGTGVCSCRAASNGVIGEDLSSLVSLGVSPGAYWQPGLGESSSPFTRSTGWYCCLTALCTSLYSET